MNKTELLELLESLRRFPIETEWLEFKEAKTNFDANELGKYFSAISNEANLKDKPYGWLIFGIKDKPIPRPVVGTQYRLDPIARESLKREVADHTTNGITLLDIFEVEHPDGRVLMLQIPAAPRGMPTAWKNHHYGRHGESIGGLSIQEIEHIRQQAQQQDWSAVLLPEAQLSDLDAAAMAKARLLYAERNRHLGEELQTWDDWTFLAKLRLARNKLLTRASLILLGKQEAANLIPDSNLQLSWILQDDNKIAVDYQHFGLPYLLNAEHIINKVRNLKYRYMPNDSIFPTEIDKYDAWVLREALHNCIAHQNYALAGKINLVERPDVLIFSNMGGFIPGDIKQVLASDAPPERYRNPVLAHAMVELKMMDTIGSGIKRIFITQQKRLFPMPDYHIDAVSQRVEVTIYGKLLDERFSMLLKSQPHITLEDAILLDDVQKQKPLTKEAVQHLRSKGWIEGRVPNIHISAILAKLTGQTGAYVKVKGLEDGFYKEYVLKFLEQVEMAKKADIESFLLEKLPDILSDEQKRNKVRNLLQQMRVAGDIKADGKVWKIAKNS